jgi:hypothetical protein
MVIGWPPSRETPILYQQPIAPPQQCLAGRITESQHHCGSNCENGGLNSREDGFQVIGVAL